MPRVAGTHFSEIIETDIYFATLGDCRAYLVHGNTIGGKAWMPKIVMGLAGQTSTGQFWSTQEEAEEEAKSKLIECDKEMKEKQEKFEQTLLHYRRILKEQEKK